MVRYVYVYAYRVLDVHPLFLFIIIYLFIFFFPLHSFYIFGITIISMVALRGRGRGNRLYVPMINTEDAGINCGKKSSFFSRGRRGDAEFKLS